MSYRKHLMTSDEPPSELYKATELNTNLAEVGTDCISRQQAINALSTITMYKGSIPFDTAVMRIEQLPSAQPERKKGKWHQRFYPQIEMMVCSECNNEFSYDAETGVRDYNFCPNCGADMRGGDA